MNIQFNAEQMALAAANREGMATGNPGISAAFRSELSSMLESKLARVESMANPASGTGQERQNLVATPGTLAGAVSAPDASPAPPASVTSAAFNVTNAPVSVTSTAVNATAPPPTSGTSGAVDATKPETDASYDDAYWNAQPPAVQQLRNITDPEKRGAMATQLAEEGYKIDVPIMLWGWDPAKTMAMREADGYTWVPSAYQNPVEAAPGISYPGGQGYDPKNPPAGSILVG